MSAHSPQHQFDSARNGGRFADALRAAIRASGLSLDRLQARLRARGTPVSIATLSYWQSGKRQPERNDSLRALGELENILGLPGGTLLSLLPPPRPRGKQVVARELPPAETDRFRHAQLRPLLQRLGLPEALEQQQHLVLVGLHDRCQLAEDGGQRSVATRAVFEPVINGPDRWLLVYTTDEGSASPALPTVRAIRNCRVGRAVTDPKHGILAAELLFDHPLIRGETYLIEYELVHSGPPYPASEKTHWREFRRAIREYLVEVQFPETCRPTRCHQFAKPAGQPHPRVRDLKVDTTNCAHAVAIDFGPGVFGIEWK